MAQIIIIIILKSGVLLVDFNTHKIIICIIQEISLI